MKVIKKNGKKDLRNREWWTKLRYLHDTGMLKLCIKNKMRAEFVFDSFYQYMSEFPTYCVTITREDGITYLYYNRVLKSVSLSNVHNFVAEIDIAFAESCAIRKILGQADILIPVLDNIVVSYVL